ncbi:MAG: Holliday junction branch migration protein RuvA [Gemmatimonadales bacterium]
MIATLTGTLAERAGDAIVLQTDGGVGYAVTVPLGVAERLPQLGTRCTLYTELVVKEDGWALFGFDQPNERLVFKRLLGASGFGPRLALGLLSALGPERTVLSIQDRDIAALTTVSGIGKRKAERLVVELQDRFADIAVATSLPRPPAAEEAVKALTILGYPAAAAEEAVRAALGDGTQDGARKDTSAVVRAALQRLTSSRRGSTV